MKKDVLPADACNRGMIDEERKELETEIQDVAGYWGGRNTPTPTIAETKVIQTKFSKHDRDYVWLAMADCETGKGRSAEETYMKLKKWHEDTDHQTPVIPVSMIKRWKVEYAEERLHFMASTNAVDTYQDLLDQCKEDRVRQAVAKDLLNRKFGEPVKKMEIQSMTMTWADVEAERKRAIEQAHEAGINIPDGEWSNPLSAELNPEVKGKDADLTQGDEDGENL